jgi:3'(2'), 5'-bisphosphate nucleotidase
MSEAKILQVARIGGWAAARLCREVSALSGSTEALYKDGGEPVTLADYGSQAVILEEISRSFPEHAIIAEEGAAHLKEEDRGDLHRTLTTLVAEVLARPVSFEQVCGFIDHRGDSDSEYTWVIDPIDGTKGFLRGDQYAVAIGILKNLEPWAGVLACPNLAADPADPNGLKGALLVGSQAGGVVRAALDSGFEQAVSVSAVEAAEEIRILGSVESAHGDPKLMTALVEAMGLGGAVVRMDSQAKYATVASGEAEIYLRPQSRPDYRERVWDHAAGVVIVEAAGGRVTDLRGEALDFTRGETLESNRGVLATNGLIHDRVLEALARIESAS